MAPVRRLLAPVTAVWLFCQVGTVASVPLALWISAADPHAEECTCGHGVGAMCPMHHKPTGRSAPCAMQAANDSGAAVLTTLAGMAGLVLEPAPALRPADPSKHSLPADVHIVGEHPVPPDPPPPRI